MSTLSDISSEQEVGGSRSTRSTRSTKSSSRSTKTKNDFEWLEDADQFIVANDPYVVDDLCKCERRAVYIAVSNLPEACMCCGQCKPYEHTLMEIESRHEMMYFSHPCGCCCQTLYIATPEQQVGVISEKCKICTPHGLIESYDGEVYLTYTGPCCGCCCGGDWIVYNGKDIIARINMEVFGLNRDFPPGGFLCINFNKELDAQHKALLLGCTVLINFTYYAKGYTRKDFWIVDMTVSE